ncbi:NACHT domain-containing protein [Priestia aryabhattai]|uniref:NACHT domain-containing protein n=1 Tax=Priestia aryabhattai TaxID=412384 RepID=UPI001C8D40C8|nr:AAA family ATPase [Priestia aryabhattai]MBY0062595.1 hypothetical protein [Priestia aryabhattai]
MEQIDWNKLGLIGESKQKTFEDLCMYLFCRELNVPKITAYENQPGIETEPVEVNGKRYGFQSKFFDSKFDWKQIKSSINKAIDTFPELDKIFVYSNKDRTMNGKEKTKIEKELDKKSKAKKITIEYVTDKSFMKKLSEPANFDLAQLFFGLGDEHGFIKNSVNANLLTFVQSSEYLSLPIITTYGDEVEDLPQVLLSEEQNVFLISGNPGSGKSILINKLLQVFGGLDKKDKKEMHEVLLQNNAVPVLINLKNCVNDSFENIIRHRKNDSKLNNQKLDFIYLFDGLDELSEKVAEDVLFQIHELSQKSNTKKIIFSCRQGNLNKVKARIYFNELKEYKIADLDNKYINKFFEVKKNENKKSKLDALKQENEKLIDDVKDVLLVRLLWDTIMNLDEKSAVLDLFSKKIDLLIEDPLHKKNIEELNILNPKKKAIIDINQEISFQNQKKFQFEFSITDLQEIILKKLERLNYKDVNDIINYITDLFFESSYVDSSNPNSTYIYQHRRYQEYFFTQKLKSEYEKKPKIIRELGILHDREYLEELFLKYLRKEYVKENNIAGLVELNLFNVYLGNDRGFGVDDSPYINSEEFFPALTNQEIDNYENIFEELKLKEKLFLDVNEINDQFRLYEEEKAHPHSNNYLRNVWENKIPSLIENIVVFWKNKKEETSLQLHKQLNDVVDLYKKNGFLEESSDGKKLRNPFWTSVEDFFYLKIVIDGKSVEEVFDNLVKDRYKIPETPESKGYDILQEFGSERLVKSFFRVCLREKKEEFFQILSSLSQYETIALLDILKTKEYLHIFIEFRSIHSQIKEFVSKLPEEFIKKNIFILFYKKILGLNLSKTELEIANEKIRNLRQKRTLDLSMNNEYLEFSTMAFITDTCSLDSYIKSWKEDDYFNVYYSELDLYASLFKEFVLLLMSERNIGLVVRNYIRYINLYFDNRPQFLKHRITELWSHIFSMNGISKQTLNQLRDVLIKEENQIIPFLFYKKLYSLNLNNFKNLVGEDELTVFEEELSSWHDDYSSYIDTCFNLSTFFSVVDNKKANYFFRKGLNEGLLRHGWRKDTIVSSLLTEALEVIWRNNWVSKVEKKKYARKVFKLTLRLYEITDGDHTSEGPYEVIKTVSKNNDIDLAEEFKNLLPRKNRHRYILNRAITSILNSKAQSGLPIESIEEGMKEYKPGYGYEGKPQADYYEQKFQVYLEIAKQELYTEEEKLVAFNKAYKQIEDAKRNNVEDSFQIVDDKKTFEKLCIKYGKDFNLEIEEDESVNNPRKIVNDFIQRVKKLRTEDGIEEAYRELEDYQNRIILTDFSSWDVLINKTCEIKGNIQLFMNYLKQSNYPSTNFWTGNSKFLHYGLASAIKNVNTRQEILDYLYESSGHAGFLNMIKTYEALNDKDTCILLFNRYLNFCDLLVN